MRTGLNQVLRPNNVMKTGPYQVCRLEVLCLPCQNDIKDRLKNSEQGDCKNSFGLNHVLRTSGGHEILVYISDNPDFSTKQE